MYIYCTVRVNLRPSYSELGMYFFSTFATFQQECLDFQRDLYAEKSSKRRGKNWKTGLKNERLDNYNRDNDSKTFEN